MARPETGLRGMHRSSALGSIKSEDCYLLNLQPSPRTTSPHGSVGTLESAENRYLNATDASATILPKMDEAEKHVTVAFR